MSLAIVAVIIALQGAAPVENPFSTQGLAEFARQERERRAGSEVEPTHMITTENAVRNGIPLVVGQIGQVGEIGQEETPPEAAEAAEAEAAIESVELEDTAVAIAQQERVVQNLEDQAVRLQLEVNRYRGEYMAPVVTQQARDEALGNMNSTQTELEAIQVQLAEARDTLDALREAAAAEAAESAP